MFAIHLAVRDPAAGPPAAADAHAVQDGLWAHARPEHGLEHVRAGVTPEGIGVVLYVQAASHREAAARARELLERALTARGRSGFSITLHP
ncbi:MULTISPECIES: hypothetical protein [Kitasatospora]|uniref:Uncharacterized protein n=2 Tax=Kitasatospora TaxID=2063 RepID=A0ABT1J638_9ACTN|nr:hypothetical protein [Kitasatospora paracochleata]MCP2312511.1 hypothetical protein [Kitasatospora paracochleata]